MHFPDSGGRDWSLGISHGGDLTLCLYVRDRLRLTPAMTRRLPEVTPEVPEYPVPAEVRPGLEEQWLAWWHDRLDAHVSGSHRAAGEPSWAFPELMASPSLHRLAQAVADEGQEWVRARKAEFVTLFRATTGQPSPVVTLGNRYAEAFSFKLSVTCLPVSSETPYLVDRGHVLVPYRLYADQPRFVNWLETAIASAGAA